MKHIGIGISVLGLAIGAAMIESFSHASSAVGDAASMFLIGGIALFFLFHEEK